MKAITQDRYGPVDLLELRDLDQPAIADDEVLVRVHAAGVDRGAWHFMTGLPYPIRLAPRPPVLGRDLAGVVAAVGRKVTRFAPGDEVLGIGTGAFAEYARAPESKLVRKPAGITYEQAATIAISGLPALHGLRDRAKVRPGQTVLVIGASGGVGTYAVQLAKAFGAEVTGVCGPAKTDLVRSIGADHVLDYTRDDFADGSRRYDVILDIAGNSPLSRLRRALAPTGTLVILGGEDNGRWTGGLGRQLGALLLSPFLRQNLRTVFPRENGADIAVLTDLVAAGTITPVLDRAYPLGEVPKAIRYLEEGHARGKVVITVC
jgi:NADPH:quinone reductase-like Zn-dependent oxidoreductase